MSVGKASIAPFINDTFTITSAWWTERWGTIHRGLDISTGKKDAVYSMLDGKVVQMWHNDSSLGNALVIKAEDNKATLYMHLDSFSVALNDSVKKGQQVGVEGTTGDSTGIHLHVEMQEMTSSTWHWSYNKSDYLDPTNFMGIDNVKGTQWVYDGTPTPTPPTPTPTITKSKNFRWVLYARRLRHSK